jgi:hypothetical protein
MTGHNNATPAEPHATGSFWWDPTKVPTPAISANQSSFSRLKPISKPLSPPNVDGPLATC